MIEKYDEFGNRVEYSAAEGEHEDPEALTALEETIERFEAEESKKFDRGRFEARAAQGGQRLGRGTRSLVEFVGDSLGLAILKTSSRKDLAYKVIKGSRTFGHGAENLVDKAVTQGGKLLGGAAEQVDVDYLRERAQEVKADLSQNVKESAVLEKVEPAKIKAKAQDVYHSVFDKLREGKDRLSGREDPVQAAKKQEELAERIAAFERLYEEEAKAEELHPECYTPEEFKETK